MVFCLCAGVSVPGIAPAAAVTRYRVRPRRLNVLPGGGSDALERLNPTRRWLAALGDQRAPVAICMTVFPW